MPEAETVRSEEPVHPRRVSGDGGYDDFPTVLMPRVHHASPTTTTNPTLGSVPSNESVYKTRPRAAGGTPHRSPLTYDERW